MLKVKNIIGRNGKEIPNQFDIITDNGRYFQSYNSTIVYKDYNGKIILDKEYWNYSRTTSKYRSIFLNESTKETTRKIEEGIYKLDNLN